MDIVKRLRKTEEETATIGQKLVYLKVPVNPDGPEGADEIERLRGDEKKYQAIISKLIAKKVADEYWSKVLHGDVVDPWAALKEGE